MAELRDYQITLKQEVYAAWQAGERNVLAVSPTGSGKTVFFGSVVHDTVGQSVAIAHRQELVNQISLQLGREGVQHRLIAPKNVIAQITREHKEELGRVWYSPTAMSTVASVDTLIARQDKLTDWAQQIRLWTIDEAHHVLRENKWGSAVAMFPNAFGLGVTATAQRADLKGLGAHADGVFHSLVLGPTTRDLIDRGYLTEYEILIPETDFDRSKLVIGSTGDFTPNSMKQAAMESHLVGDVVETYMKHALGKLDIVFAVNVETADQIAAQFRMCGIPAASVSAKTDASERNRIIKAFRRREILVLVNVDLFGEGFDVPAVEVVQMARPTQSLGLYLQQFGRALRIMAGKLYALIIDHVSNVKTHGLPDRQRYWTLDALKRSRERDPDEIPVTSCKKCLKAFERITHVCPYCGHDQTEDDGTGSGGRKTPEMVDGDLILLDRATLEQMRKAIVLEAPGALAQRVGRTAGEYAAKKAVRDQIDRIDAQRQLSEAIALWAGYQRAKQRSDNESYRRFYHWLGVDVLTALSLPRAGMDDIRIKIEEHLK